MAASLRTRGRPGWVGPGLGALLLASTVIALHLLGGHDLAAPPISSIEGWSSWAQEREPATVALVGVRLGALVVGYHLIATSALAAIGRLLDRPRLVHVAEVATPRALRGTVRRLAGLGLSASAALATPLAGAGAGPVPGTATVAVTETTSDGTATLERVDTGRPTPEARSVPARPPSPRPAPPRPDAAAPPPRVSPAPPAAPVDPPSVRRVVGVGDHLWSIAEEHLAGAWGRPPTDHEVDAYWRTVVAANPAVGDPDLLFVGDVILVPPPPPAPT